MLKLTLFDTMRKQFWIAFNRPFSTIMVDNLNSKNYIFYRSTGRNSYYPDTWFPCNGIEVDWIIKPGTLTYEQRVACYSRAMVHYLEDEAPLDQELLHSILSRFGNIECMLISYAIGGGFWNTSDAFYFKFAIKKYFLSQFLCLKNNLNELDAFRNLDTQTIPRINILLAEDIDNDEIQEKEKINKVNQFNQHLFGRAINISDIKEGRRYEEMSMDYRIEANPYSGTSFSSKWKHLCQICMDYRKSLIPGSFGWWQQSKEINSLCAYLFEPKEISEQTFDAFSKKFKEVKLVFLSNRTEQQRQFVRAVLDAQSLGLSSFKGIWSKQQPITTEAPVESRPFKRMKIT